MASRRLLLPFLAAGAAALAVQRVQAATTGKTLVLVFQRYAPDWINLLVPAGDPAYATLRPKLAIRNPLMLDDYFGLHPSLASLQPLFSAGDLAFVTATGWLDTAARDRSHLKAQLLAELGTPAQASSGWAARYLHAETKPVALWTALAAGRSIPSSLQGYPEALALSDFSDLEQTAAAGDTATQLALQLAGLAGVAGSTALRLAQMQQSVAGLDLPSSASYPDTELGRGLKLASQAIRAGLAPRLIAVNSSDDWDTHVKQSNRHQKALPGFAAALRSFHDELGSQMQDVLLVTMSEFGRKARESLGGTDHGTGSSMLLMGGGVRGGRVYGQWPGLQSEALYEGEDLMPTTDFRAVLGEILARHMSLDTALIETVFPGGYAGTEYWRGFLSPN